MLAKPGVFKPFYDKGTDLAATLLARRTSGRPAARRCGAGSPTIPALDLIYFGVGNPGPYNPEQRAGDNKWTNSVLARRPSDGALVWAYQFTPHDSWDYDATGDMLLADLVDQGEAAEDARPFRQERLRLHARPRHRRGARRRALREGELGEAHRSQDRPPASSTRARSPARRAGWSRTSAPPSRAAKSPASSAAYSPRTKLFYATTNNMCMDYEAPKATHLAGTPFIGANAPYHAGPGGHMGSLHRVGPGAGQEGLGDHGGLPRVERRRGHRGRRGVLRHARRLVQGRRRAQRPRALEDSRSAPASSATRSPSSAPTASSTSRSTPASAATGSCSRATCAPTIRRTSASPPTSRRISRGIRVRAGWFGSSRCRGEGEMRGLGARRSALGKLLVFVLVFVLGAVRVSTEGDTTKTTTTSSRSTTPTARKNTAPKESTSGPDLSGRARRPERKGSRRTAIAGRLECDRRGARSSSSP